MDGVLGDPRRRSPQRALTLAPHSPPQGARPRGSCHRAAQQKRSRRLTGFPVRTHAVSTRIAPLQTTAFSRAVVGISTRAANQGGRVPTYFHDEGLHQSAPSTSFTSRRPAPRPPRPPLKSNARPRNRVRRLPPGKTPSGRSPSSPLRAPPSGPPARTSATSSRRLDSTPRSCAGSRSSASPRLDRSSARPSPPSSRAGTSWASRRRGRARPRPSRCPFSSTCAAAAVNDAARGRS